MIDLQRLVEQLPRRLERDRPRRAPARAGRRVRGRRDATSTRSSAVEGRDALDATIGAVQQQFPGCVFALAGPVDAHHDDARFTWGLGRPGEEPLVVGFDVATVAAGGRIADGARLPRPGAGGGLRERAVSPIANLPGGPASSGR